MTDLIRAPRSAPRDDGGALDLVKLYPACAFLAEGPLRGRTREEITPLPLRFWTVQAFPNYIIVYDPQSDPLQIIRILHGSRDLLAILGEAKP